MIVVLTIMTTTTTAIAIAADIHITYFKDPSFYNVSLVLDDYSNLSDVVRVYPTLEGRDAFTNISAQARMAGFMNSKVVEPSPVE